MQITVTGRHMDVSDSLRNYAEEKVNRAAKLLDGNNMTAEVRLHVEKNPSIENPKVAEITLFMGGRVVRAEEASTDMYAALDLATEKLERQLRKYKTKVLDRHNGKVKVKTAPGDREIATFTGDLVMATDEEHEPMIVRTKTLDMKPMTEDEAVLQLELLGHDFFVFQHSDNDLVHVLYRRTDGDYGLIRPR
jgi:putative sigma-54 modulation protein